MLELMLGFSTAAIAMGLGLAALIAAIAWRLDMLQASGALAATLLGGLTYGLGGLPAAILLVAFFISSSLLTRADSARKREVAKIFSKGGRRDWAQVLANGGIGLAALVIGALGWLAIPLAWAVYAGALATANADTWATELGVLSSRSPVLITTRKRVVKGTSGGITPHGNLAAFAGAALIGLLTAPFAGGWKMFVIIALAGLFGSSFDSFLGATVQAIYYCPRCKKETEKHPLHGCGTRTTLRRGWPWLDNDLVNFFSGLLGALMALGAAALWL